MKTVTVEVYGFVGHGPNLKEAKGAAQIEARKAMSGSYLPAAMSLRGHMMLVWREPRTGWQSRLLNNAGDYSVALFGNSGYQDRDECVVAAKYHLCQVAWVAGGDNADILKFCPPSRQSDLRHWIAWQEDYARLIAEGKPDHEAHQLARAIII